MEWNKVNGAGVNAFALKLHFRAIGTLGGFPAY
jgi:hypothetical protein